MTTITHQVFNIAHKETEGFIDTHESCYHEQKTETGSHVTELQFHLEAQEVPIQLPASTNHSLGPQHF